MSALIETKQTQPPPRNDVLMAHKTSSISATAAKHSWYAAPVQRNSFVTFIYVSAILMNGSTDPVLRWGGLEPYPGHARSYET